MRCSVLIPYMADTLLHKQPLFGDGIKKVHLEKGGGANHFQGDKMSLRHDDVA